MAGWLYMQDCGGRWRRVVSCIMNNAKAEPQAVPVLPLGWLNDSQSRKNRWLAVHAPGSRVCHILCVYLCGASIEIKLHAETDFRVSTRRRIRSISRFFSNILYRVPDTTFDRWLNAEFQRGRVKGRVFKYDARVSREFEDCWVSIEFLRYYVHTCRYKNCFALI